jgi:hypothetical protein
VESSAFFTTEPDDGWGGTRTVLNTGLIDAIAKEPIDLADDLDVAQALSQLVHDELRRYGTDSTNALSDIQIAGAIRALDSSNAVGNFCFEVSLSYRRVELPRRVSATV